MKYWILIAAGLGFCVPLDRTTAEDKIPGSAVHAQSCFFRVRDKAEIPARERGFLSQLNVQEGDEIQQGQILGTLDDTESLLKLDLARLDIDIAEKKRADSVAVQVAESTSSEAEKLLTQAQTEHELSVKVAASDIPIRQSEKECDLHRGDLDRALAAKKEFSSSVSDQELAKLTSAYDQSVLKHEAAKLEQQLNSMRTRSKQFAMEQQQIAVKRLTLAVAEARSELGVADLTIQSLRKAAALAEDSVERRKLRAPLTGIVVERLKHSGEWLEAGQPVYLVIGLDVLLVEGFFHADTGAYLRKGQPIQVETEVQGSRVRLQGKITFVSPEIDPANQEMLVRAEVINPQRSLRPGQSADMWVLPPDGSP